MTTDFKATTAKYATIAILCAAIHNAILISFDAFGIHYAISNLVAYPLCLIVGYTFQSRWTFNQPTSRAAFLRYAAPTLANYPVSVALLFLMSDLMHLPMIVASPLVTVIMMLWNFLATRWALMGTRTPVASTS